MQQVLLNREIRNASEYFKLLSYSDISYNYQQFVRKFHD